MSLITQIERQSDELAEAEAAGNLLRASDDLDDIFASLDDHSNEQIGAMIRAGIAKYRRKLREERSQEYRD